MTAIARGQYTIAIINDGIDGIDGVDGQSAVAYQLEITPDAISKTASGVLSSATITAKAYKIVGSSPRVAYSGRFKIYWDSTLKYTSTANESSKSYNASNAIKTIKVELYEAGGTTTLLASTSVLIVSEGQQGIQGVQGAVIRNRGKWVVGADYYNSANYIDVVVNSDGNYYQAITSHTATSTNYPSGDGNSTWSPFNEFNSVATEVLLAGKGNVDILGAGQLFVGDMDSNGSRANGWVLTNGRIQHIKNGVAGVTFDSDGKSYYPDGNSIIIGNAPIDDYTDSKIADAVDNIEVGNRNYVRDTSNEWTIKDSFTGLANQTWYGKYFYLTDLNIDDTLTVSFDLEWENLVVTEGQSLNIFTQGNGDVTGWNYGFPNFNFSSEINKNLSGGSLHCNETFKLNANQKQNNTIRFHFRLDYIASGKLKVRNLRVTKGNKEVDWSAAPEDIASAISSAQTSADTANTSISAMNDDGTFDIVEKQIIRTEWEKIYGNKSLTISGNGSWKKSKDLSVANGVSTTNTYYVALDTAGNALKTFLTTWELYDNINSSGFTRDAMSLLFASYYNAEKTLLDYASQVQAQTKVDNIEIGGVNFINNSKSFENWLGIGSNYTTTDGILELNSGLITSGWKEVYSSPVSISYKSASGNYILSAKIKCEDLSKLSVYLSFAPFNGTTRIIDGSNYNIDTDSKITAKPLADGWVLYSVIIDDVEWEKLNASSSATSATVYRAQFKVNLLSSNLSTYKPVYMKEMQLEKGNKVTAWSPSQSDIDSAISSAQTSADNAQSAATTAQNNIVSLNNTMNGSFKDGVIDEAERKAILQQLNVVNESWKDLEATYNIVYANTYLPSGTIKTTLLNTKITIAGYYSSLVTSITNISNATALTTALKTAYNTAYSTYINYVPTFKTALENANKAIQANLDSISKGYVDNLEIGDVNLLSRLNWKQGAYLTASGSYNSGIRTYICSDYSINIVGGENYILQRESDDENNQIQVLFYANDVYLGSSASKSVKMGNLFITAPENATTVKFNYRNSDNSNIVPIAIQTDKVGFYKGNKATAWSPSQADIDSSIKDISDNLENMEIGGENLASGADTIKAVHNTVYLRLLDKPKIVRMLNASGQFVLSAFISSDSGYGTASITLKYSDGTSGTFSLTETSGFQGRSHRTFSLNKTVTDIGDFYLQGSYTEVYQPQLETGNKLTAYKSPNDSIYLDGKNLFSQNKCTEGKYLTSAGAEYVNTSWGYSDYIDVSNCSCLIASGYTNLGSAQSCVFYDSSKKMTRALTNNGTSVNKNIYPNATEAYIRFSFQLSDIKTLKIEKGSVATEYVENEYDAIPNLLATGIDTKGKRIIATADKFLFRSNSGTEMAVFEEVNGKGRLKTDMIDAEKLKVSTLQFSFKTPTSTSDYIVTSSSPSNINGLNKKIILSCTEACVGMMITVFNQTTYPNERASQLGCTLMYCENGFGNLPENTGTYLGYTRYNPEELPTNIQFYGGVMQLCCVKEYGYIHTVDEVGNPTGWEDGYAIRWVLLNDSFKALSSIYRTPDATVLQWDCDSKLNTPISSSESNVIRIMKWNDYLNLNASNSTVNTTSFLPTDAKKGKRVRIMNNSTGSRYIRGTNKCITSGINWTDGTLITLPTNRSIDLMLVDLIWVYNVL